MTVEKFEVNFDRLTGNSQFLWQTRLYRDWFLHGNLPAAIVLPTGRGKTMVMAIPLRD